MGVSLATPFLRGCSGAVASWFAGMVDFKPSGEVWLSVVLILEIVRVLS